MAIFDYYWRTFVIGRCIDSIFVPQNEPGEKSQSKKPATRNLTWKSFILYSILVI
jgi:hypothetical protein